MTAGRQCERERERLQEAGPSVVWTHWSKVCSTMSGYRLTKIQVNGVEYPQLQPGAITRTTHQVNLKQAIPLKHFSEELQTFCILFHFAEPQPPGLPRWLIDFRDLHLFNSCKGNMHWIYFTAEQCVWIISYSKFHAIFCMHQLNSLFIPKSYCWCVHIRLIFVCFSSY